MKKCVEGAALLCLAVLWAGCQQSSEPARTAAPPAPAAQASSADTATSAGALTLVKLKVPNMT